MSSPENATGAGRGANGIEVPADWFENQKTYAVVLDSIRGDIETPDSFAIKFSLLAKIPLAKVKHLMRRLPVRIWSGPGRGRAERILALIEEAGGKGSIHEAGSKPVEEPRAKSLDDRPSCRYCGFPLNEGDTICGFCRTRIDAVPASADPDAAASSAEPSATGIRRLPVFPRKRLLLYGAVLLAGAIVLLALR